MADGQLLQVSPAFGRAMESVDTTAICAAVFPALKARAAAGRDGRAVRNLIAVAAEGYPFPTDLDRDQPGAARVRGLVRAGAGHDPDRGAARRRTGRRRADERELCSAGA